MALAKGISSSSSRILLAAATSTGLREVNREEKRGIERRVTTTTF
jgi:hypothetical protein